MHASRYTADQRRDGRRVRTVTWRQLGTICLVLLATGFVGPLAKPASATVPSHMETALANAHDVGQRDTLPAATPDRPGQVLAARYEIHWCRQMTPTDRPRARVTCLLREYDVWVYRPGFSMVLEPQMDTLVQTIKYANRSGYDVRDIWACGCATTPRRSGWM